MEIYFSQRHLEEYSTHQRLLFTLHKKEYIWPSYHSSEQSMFNEINKLKRHRNSTFAELLYDTWPGIV